MSLLKPLLSLIRSIIHSDDFFERSRVNGSAFTRNRILDFSKTLIYILWCAKTSLPSTLHAFLEDILKGRSSCTRQAFSKRRKLIKPEAFEELYRASSEFLVKSVPSVTGALRKFAIDGSRVNLVSHPELVKTFGIQKGTGGLPQALISTLYDVENHFSIDVQIRPHDGNEREMAQAHLERLKQLMGDSPYLVIFDRGYPSGKLLETFANSSGYFLMRCPTEFVRALDKWKKDAWFTHKFHSVKQPLTFRVIRVVLPDGTEEILCTNLPNSYSASDVMDLYLHRWRIEISYDFLKNRVQLENLSGITLCAFFQQLFACLLMSNLCAAYYCENRVYEIEDGNAPSLMLHPSDDRPHKRDRRINMATVLAAIRSILPLVLVMPRSHLSRWIFLIDVHRLKNVFRYDKKGRKKPRLRVHPGLKFTQSQRPSF